MKRISTILFFFSCLGIYLTLESKQVELYFNHTIQEDFVLNSPIDDQILESPWHDRADNHRIYCQRLLIENKGNQILEGCLPFVNQSNLYTLDQLHQEISKAEQPLLALYQLWNQSIYICPDATIEKDPLFLLNFEGCCSKELYLKSFTKLCHLMGISTRPIDIHGKEFYDFQDQENWKLIDPLSKQLYLALDNRSLVSSEEVKDDPFLALRTKYDRHKEQIDFKKAWEHLARFEIVIPCLGQESSSAPSKENLQATKGFNLYPEEQLIYQCQDSNREIPLNQSVVQHILNPQARQQNNAFEYTSPFPIKAICNNTSKPILVKLYHHSIQPGETFTLPNLNIFSLNLTVDNNSSGQINMVSTCAWHIFPRLVRGVNHVHLGAEHNPTSIELVYDLNADVETLPLCALKVINDSSIFDHCTPFFQIEAAQDANIESIWWQISSHSQFDLIPANFEQVESFTTAIHLPPITDTFFNAYEPYFFRIKACVNGIWGEWSETFSFSVKKPQSIKNIEFNKIADYQYEISWDTQIDATDYLIFGSNSLDFIPSVYCDTQINALVDGQVVDMEPNHNLIAIVTDTKFIVDGSLAYYRIIARHQDQLSVPSTLIHVYDQDLPYVRTILQVSELDDQHEIVKRTSLPKGYEGIDSTTVIPTPHKEHFLSQFLRSSSYLPSQTPNPFRAYTPIPHVPAPIWEKVTPYLLPENHPIKAKLDRMFSANRVTLNPDTFRRAGFRRYRPGRFSRVMASNHPHLLGYFIKAFADTEVTIREDWRKWITRIEGAKSIQGCILRHGYQNKFKVPNKWIYPLPTEPSPPVNPTKYLRKNFILIAEDVRAYDHETNEKKYRKDMNHHLLDAFYTILNEEGLFDSVFAFNVPFCKDGKLAFIDTEYHHKWPVPFYKINRYLSSDMTQYWNKLINQGGPKHKH